jgi:hypothetical protein
MTKITTLMRCISIANSKLRRAVVVLATTVAAAVGSPLVAPSPAYAGGSVCAWIGSSPTAGRISLQQTCGVSGTYHMDIWGAGHKRTHTRDYRYNGGVREWFFNWNIRSGARVCGELWYHRPGGGYESKGLPCWTRP